MMTHGGDQQAKVREQAADWFARLKTLPVSQATLEQFFEWRRIDVHEAAFDEVERLWGRAGLVADHPEIRQATQSAYDRPHRRRLAIAGSALALVAVAGAFVGLHRPGDRYVTGVGQQSVIALADGSKLTLDTDTKLVVRLEKDARHVELDHGQAYFSVAHDPSRPFTVEAGGVQVLATGTQFDVRHTGQATDVTLVEGSVAVRSPGAQEGQRMTAGQAVTVLSGQVPIVRRVDTAVATSWKRGQIVLDGMTLGQAIAEVNRYTARPVVLDAPRYAGSRIGGSFETGDIESFVQATTALLPLRAVRESDGGIHLVDPNSQGSG
ncbi:MAG: FecR family protein [Sphingomonas oligoaromativorans]